MTQQATRFWQVCARSTRPLFIDDWRSKMVAWLGFKPRRISALAEAALYGCLDCISHLPEFHTEIGRKKWLDQLSTLRLATQYGTYSATHRVIRETQNELPMPFTFLQSQLSQVPVTLATALNWQGDASILLAENDHLFIKMSLLSSHTGDVLLGWINELNQEWPDYTHWIWLSPCEKPNEGEWDHSLCITDSLIKYIRLDDQGIGFQ